MASPPMRRAAFGLKNFGNGVCIQRIGGEAINRLRGQGHDFTGALEFGGAFHGGVEQRLGVRG